eukprot:gene3212-2194_t
MKSHTTESHQTREHPPGKTQVTASPTHYTHVSTAAWHLRYTTTTNMYAPNYSPVIQQKLRNNLLPNPKKRNLQKPIASSNKPPTMKTLNGSGTKPLTHGPTITQHTEHQVHVAQTPHCGNHASHGSPHCAVHKYKIIKHKHTTTQPPAPTYLQLNQTNHAESQSHTERINTQLAIYYTRSRVERQPKPQRLANPHLQDHAKLKDLIRTTIKVHILTARKSKHITSIRRNIPTKAQTNQLTQMPRK